MKRSLFLVLIFLAAASFAAAQITTVTTDVLGAHLNYGRGCAACHAPHSGAYGNGAARSSDPNAGVIALWGEDASSLYGVSITTGQSEHGSFVEPLPGGLAAGTPDVSGVLMCLSCHDGNLAKGAMMKGTVYETLPATYGTYNSIPTLLGNDGSTAGNYLNDHPVGIKADIGCGGPYDWDCTITAGGGIIPGPKMLQFITDYGWFVRPAAYNGQPTVMCTTCHNQHVMNMVNVTNNVATYNPTTDTKGVPSGTSGLPAGTYATMFFVRAPYNPMHATATNNQTAQFCRECHGGESNEMNGSTAGTTF